MKVQLSADHDTYVHFYAQDAAGNESDYANINLGKGEAVTRPDSVCGFRCRLR